jgi:hypothetical protein
MSARAVPVAARAEGDPPPGGSPARARRAPSGRRTRAQGIEASGMLRGRPDRLAALARRGIMTGVRQAGERRPAWVHAPEPW